LTPQALEGFFTEYFVNTSVPGLISRRSQQRLVHFFFKLTK